MTGSSLDRRRRRVLFVPFFFLGLTACLPGHLQKYRPTTGQEVRQSEPDVQRAARQAPPARKIAAIYPVGRRTFRFRLPYTDVWNAALDVLMNNYNLTIVDSQSGVITTEWDSYFLNERVYRNRISLRIRQSAWNEVDVTLYNNLENLRENVWLPATGGSRELGRVLRNMALQLKKRPPQMPEEMMAASPESPREGG